MEQRAWPGPKPKLYINEGAESHCAKLRELLFALVSFIFLNLGYDKGEAVGRCHPLFCCVRNLVL